MTIIKYMPFRFSPEETKNAYRVSVLDYINYKPGKYSFAEKKITKTDDSGKTVETTVKYNKKKVMDIFRYGEPVDGFFILQGDISSDKTFVSAVDFVAKVEGYSAHEALTEVYLTCFGFPSDYLEKNNQVSNEKRNAPAFSPVDLEFMSEDELFELRPSLCHIKEWTIAPPEKKFELMLMFYTGAECDAVLHKYGKKVNSFAYNPQPQNFIAPYATLYATNVADFLINTYNIREDFVSWLIRKHLVYEDEKGNMIAPGYDENKNIVYAHMRSCYNPDSSRSNPYYIDEVCINSSRDYCWHYTNEQSDKLYIFDDILSVFCFMNMLEIAVSTRTEAFDEMKLSSYIFVGHTRGEEMKSIPYCLDKYLARHPHVRRLYFCYSNEVIRGINYGQMEASRLYKLITNEYKDRYIIENLLPKEYTSFAELLMKEGESFNE